MAFATTSDIATRLGRSLTAAEAAMAQQVIDLVTGMIVTAAGQDDAWAAGLDPIPAYYKALCIDRVMRVGVNPELVQSMTEQLGSHSTTRTFPRDAAGGVFLTDQELLLVSRFAGSPSSGSARTESLVHDVYVTEATE